MHDRTSITSRLDTMAVNTAPNVTPRSGQASTRSRGITICAATYGRPAGLRALLEGLRQIARPMPTPDTADGALELDVVIVDNDPKQSGRVIVEDMMPGYPWPLRYVAEPRPGIAHARNAAVAAVSPRASHLAFIDDDEVPDGQWLSALWDTSVRYQADVVCGPVVPRFSLRTPDWARQGRFFEWPRYPTGTLLPYARTGNVLIALQVLKLVPQPFDPRFSLTGGEDHHLFLRLHQLGVKIVWCDEAVVTETVADERLQIDYVVQRAFRMYASHTYCERELWPAYQVYPWRIATGSVRIGLGFLQWLTAIGGAKYRRVQAMVQIARGAGLWAGLLGIHHREYASRR